MALPLTLSRLPLARWSLPLTYLLVGLGTYPGCTFPEYEIASLDATAGGVSEEGGATSGGSAAGDNAAGCGAEACSMCEPGRADCNQLSEDGCETSLSTLADCGACGVACSNEHGTNVCVPGSDGRSAHCKPSCAPGFRDCDLRPSNGCETSLNSDVMNCGACGRSCPANGGEPVCVAGECGVSSCNFGFADCSNTGTCNYNLASDPLNCGQCGNVCSSAHGEARCNAGVCVTDCEAGYGDCNSGSVNDGCETRLNQPDSGGNVPNCGACGAFCQRRAYTTINLEQCSLGVCFRDCMSGAHDCRNNRNEPGCSGTGCGCEFEPCQ